jgi:hypothetical protein
MSETGVNLLGTPEDTLEQMTSTVGSVCYHTEVSSLKLKCMCVRSVCKFFIPQMIYEYGEPR